MSKKHPNVLTDDSEKHLIVRLCRIDDSGSWRGHTGRGQETFANWLRLNLNMNPKRYENGRKALEETGQLYSLMLVKEVIES